MLGDYCTFSDLMLEHEAADGVPMLAYRSSSKLNGKTVPDTSLPLYDTVSLDDLRAPYKPLMTAAESEARAVALTVVSKEDRELLMRKHLDLSRLEFIAKYAHLTHEATHKRLDRAEQRMRRKLAQEGLDAIMDIGAEREPRAPYSFSQGARLAGLHPRTASVSALCLRFAGWPVTHDGLMYAEDVDFLRSWHEPAMKTYDSVPYAYKMPRKSGWSRYRIAGERLRRQHESQVALAA